MAVVFITPIVFNTREVFRFGSLSCTWIEARRKSIFFLVVAVH
jgi:hypothetical protein